MSKISRQSKLHRHEAAKQKCRIFQRSQSTNVLSRDFVPMPGQFAVLHAPKGKKQQLPLIQQRDDVKFTTNLKLIMKEKNPSLAYDIVHEVVNRRISQSRSKLSLRKSGSQKVMKPISEHIYEQTMAVGESVNQCQLITNAYLYDHNQRNESKNKTPSRARHPIPKHVHGYKMIKLGNERKLRLESHAARERTQEHTILQASEGDAARFLPIEYYLVDNETPQMLLDRYSKENVQGLAIGYSRWYGLNNQYTWKMCKVLGYNSRNERWQIQWFHNGKRKEVARNNLHFEGENRREFLKKLAVAEQYRKKSEIFMRYNWIIDEMKTPVHQLDQQILERIARLLDNRLPKSQRNSQLVLLFSEVKSLYCRANHQAQFNFALPYQESYKKEFEEFLPDCLLQPNQQIKMRFISPKWVPDQSYYLANSLFKTNAAKFKARTALTSKEKLKILQYLNEIEQKLQTMSFLSWKAEKVYTVDELRNTLENKFSQMRNEINCIVCEVEHKVGNYLDVVYLEKKFTVSEVYENIMAAQRKFLYMVNHRIQNVIRKILTNTFQAISAAFAIQNVSPDRLSTIETLAKAPTKLKVSIIVLLKDSALQCEPPLEDVEQLYSNIMKQLMDYLVGIPCLSKTYMGNLRPENKMQIWRQLPTADKECSYFVRQVGNAKRKLDEEVKQAFELVRFYKEYLNEIMQKIIGWSNELRKKTYKKQNYQEFEEIIINVRKLEETLNSLWSMAYSQRLPNSEVSETVSGTFVKFCVFVIGINDVLTKGKKKIAELMKDVYRMVYERVARQKEKIDIQIDNVIQRLSQEPHSIDEMIHLQNYAREEAEKQVREIKKKVRETFNKLEILKLTKQPLEFSEFEQVCRIYLKPAKVCSQIAQTLTQIEEKYKKHFGELLTKDAAKLQMEIKQCQQLFACCLKVDSIEGMNDSFRLFINLHKQLEEATVRMETINGQEKAMKWILTDFSRLDAIRNQFRPYYSLISLVKNFKCHFELLLMEPFCEINYSEIAEQATLALNECGLLLIVFADNASMLPIVTSAQRLYIGFSSNLPVIKSLRNADLRERHWQSIKQTTKIGNIESDKITFFEMLSQGILGHVKELEDISNTATRELIFEKRLNRIKKQWKQIRLTVASEKKAAFSKDDETKQYKRVTNLASIREKVEHDIYQVQDILSASHIKFLESDVLSWKNQVLYKIYELIESWEHFQSELDLITSIFVQQVPRNELPKEFLKFKLIEKSWRSILLQAETQQTLLQLLQIKVVDTIRQFTTSLQEIRSQLHIYFDEKKQSCARLGCMSNHEYINYLSCIQEEADESGTLQDAVKKCFQTISKLVTDETNCILKILTNFNQQIVLSKKIPTSAPMGIIQEEIKHCLRRSIDEMSDNSLNKITQIMHLYLRLKFTQQIENELTTRSGVSQNYLEDLHQTKNQTIKLMRNSLVAKSEITLMQILSQIRVVTRLWKMQVTSPLSFEWISEARAYFRDRNYSVNIGLHSMKYAFEIVDMDSLIVDDITAKMFLNLSMVMRERCFGLVYGPRFSGKTATIKQLAATFGSKEYILESNCLVSNLNIIEYLKMATSGIWIVFENIHLLPREIISVFSRFLQLFWASFCANYLMRSFEPRYLMLDGKTILHKGNYITLFATATASAYENGKQIDKNLRQYYRTVELVCLDLQYIIKVKLIMVDLRSISERKIQSIVHRLSQLIKKQSIFAVEFSELLIISQLFRQVKVVLQRSPLEEDDLRNQLQNKIIERALYRLVMSVTIQQLHRNVILKQLQYEFSIFIKDIDLQQATTYLKEKLNLMFVTSRLTYNNEILSQCIQFVEAVSTKNQIFLTGAVESGKSTFLTLISNPKTQPTIVLHKINPNAYTMQQLYGNKVDLNGIINKLIIATAKSLKTNSDGPMQGILFQAEIQQWIEPLAAIFTTTHIVQPNCNTIIVLEQLKLIFEVQSLSLVAPSLMINANIIFFKQNLEWQSVFMAHLQRFPEVYLKANLVSNFEILVPLILEPVIDFYENNFKDSKSSSSQAAYYAQPIVLVSSICKLYLSLLEYYFHKGIAIELENHEQLQLKCHFMNLFVMALIWTVGALLSQDMRKIFSRHFKYLIKRAIQVNMKQIDKDIIPPGEDSLFDFSYTKGQWERWETNPSVNFADNLSLIGLPTFKRFHFIMQRYVENTHSVYLIGEPSSQKKTIFGSFLSCIHNEYFNKHQLCFNTNSSCSHLKAEILKETAKQKYSHSLGGFVHGKKTLYYICDVNMPALKGHPKRIVSAHEFINHYYQTQGWYLRDSIEHFMFKKIIFCGTANVNIPLTRSFRKNMNLIRCFWEEALIRNILSSILSSSEIIQPYQGMFINLILSLDRVARRQLAACAFLGFHQSDLILISKALGYLVQDGTQEEESFEVRRNRIVRKWIYISEKMYQQKFTNKQSQKLFYLINNVLMEEVKIRYKIVCADSHILFSSVDLSVRPSTVLTLKSTKRAERLEAKTEQIITKGKTNYQLRNRLDKQETVVKDVYFHEVPLMNLKEFLEKQINLKLQIMNEDNLDQTPELSLNEADIQLFVDISNSFELQSSVIVAFDINDPEYLPTDHARLQVVLQAISIFQNQKLFTLQADLQRAHHYPSEQQLRSRSEWRSLCLQMYQYMIVCLIKNEPCNVILCLEGLSEVESFIMNDIIRAIQLKSLPFEDELIDLLDNYQDSLKTLRVPHSQEKLGSQTRKQTKNKAKEIKFEYNQKEKSKKIQFISNLIVDKLRIVVSIQKKTLDLVEKDPFVNDIRQFFKEFAIVWVKKFGRVPSQNSQQKLKQTHKLIENKKIQGIITEIGQEGDQIQSPSQEPVSSLTQIEVESLRQLHGRIVRYEREKSQAKTDEVSGKGHQSQNNLLRMYTDIKAEIGNNATEFLKDLKNRLQYISLLKTLKDMTLQQVKLAKLKSLQLKEEQNSLQRINKDLEEQTRSQNMRINRLKQQAQQLRHNNAVLKEQYEYAIAGPKQQFMMRRVALVEVIKQNKEKKVLIPTSETKQWLQALGVLLERRIKKDEEIYKEVAKDITNPVTNPKIVKKIQELTNGSLNDKTFLKLKEISVVEKVESNAVTANKKQGTNDKLTVVMKHMIIAWLNLHRFCQTADVVQSQRILQEQEAHLTSVQGNLNKCLSTYECSVLQASKLKVCENLEANSEARKVIDSKISSYDDLANALKSLFQIPQLKLGWDLSNQENVYIQKVITELHETIHETQYFLQRIKEYAFTISAKIYFYKYFESKADIFPNSSSNQPQLELLKDDDFLFLSNILPYFTSMNCPTGQSSRSVKKIPKVRNKLTPLQIYRITSTAKKQLEQKSLFPLLPFANGVLLIKVQDSLQCKQPKADLSNCANISDRLMNLFGDFMVTLPDLIRIVQNKKYSSKATVAINTQQSISSTYRHSQCGLEREDIIKDNDDETNSHDYKANQAVFYPRQKKRILFVCLRFQEQIHDLIKVGFECKETFLNENIVVIALTDCSFVHDSETGIIILEVNKDNSLQIAQQMEQILCFERKQSDEQVLQALSLKRKELQLKRIQSKSFYSDEAMVKLQNIFKVLKEENIESENQERTIQDQWSSYEVKHSLKKFSQFTQFVNKLSSHYMEEAELKQTITLNPFSASCEAIKSNILCQKTVAYLIKLRRLLQHFEREKLLTPCQQISEFVEFIRGIVQLQKAKNKKINLNKINMDIRLLVWNHLVPFCHSNTYLLDLIFTIAGQDVQGVSDIELCQFLCQCLDVYKESSNLAMICTGLDDKLNLIDIYLSQTDIKERLLDKLQRVSLVCRVFKSISEHISKAKPLWTNFFKAMSCKTVRLPEPYDNYNKLFVFYFICLLKPALVQQWIRENECDKLISYSFDEFGKQKSMSLAQTSCIAFGDSFGDTINFFRNQLLLNQIMLVGDNNLKQITQVCIYKKLSLVVADFVPAIQSQVIESSKSRQKQGEEITLAQSSELKNNVRQLVVQQIKRAIMNESWVFINLQHCYLIGLSISEYYKLISTILNQELREYASEPKHTEEKISEVKQSQTVSDKIRLHYPRRFIIFSLRERSGIAEFRKILPFTRLRSYQVCTEESCRFQNVSHRQMIFAREAYNMKLKYYSSVASAQQLKRQYDDLGKVSKRIIFILLHVCEQSLKKSIGLESGKCFQIFSQYPLFQIANKICSAIAVIKYDLKLKEMKQQQQKMINQTIQRRKDKESNLKSMKHLTKTDTESKIQTFLESYLLCHIAYFFDSGSHLSPQGSHFHLTEDYFESLSSKFCENDNTYTQYFKNLSCTTADYPSCHQSILEQLQSSESAMSNYKAEINSGVGEKHNILLLQIEQQNRQAKLNKIGKLITPSKNLWLQFTREIATAKLIVSDLKLFNFQTKLNTCVSLVDKIESALYAFERHDNESTVKGINQSKDNNCERKFHQVDLNSSKIRQWLMSEIMLLKDKLGYRISLLGNFKKLCDEFEAAIQLTLTTHRIKPKIAEQITEDQDDPKELILKEIAAKMQLIHSINSIKLEFERLCQSLLPYSNQSLLYQNKNATKPNCINLAMKLNQYCPYESCLASMVNFANSQQKIQRECLGIFENSQKYFAWASTPHRRNRPGYRLIFDLTYVSFAELMPILRAYYAQERNLQEYQLCHKLFFQEHLQNENVLCYLTGFDIKNAAFIQSDPKQKESNFLQLIIQPNRQMIDRKTLISVVISVDQTTTSELLEGQERSKYRCPLYFQKGDFEARETVEIYLNESIIEQLIENAVHLQAF